MLPAALWAPLVLVALPVQVESADCPSGPQIEQALASRLAPAAPDTRPDRVHVWKQDGLLHIELVNPDSAIIAERTLVERGSCQETAELVAVVVASWETDVHPAFAEPPANIVAAASASTPAPPKTAATPPLSSSFDFALGAGPSLASSVALAGAASFTWIPRGSGLGLRLSALADGQRNLSLGGGRAAWRRGMVGAEADWRSSRGRASFDVYAGLRAGRLSVEGRDFEVNQSQTSFFPALALGGRVAWWANRRLAVWLDILGVLSLRTQSTYALPGSEEHRLPKFQGLALLGVALGRADFAR
jgi:hypothetical protein